MRQLLVSCVARMLLLEGEGMPAHWEKALRKNGQLAVDIILTVQKWHFEPQNVPDAREESVVPIYEEAAQKNEEIKKEEGEDGAAEESQDAEMTNGVEHSGEEDEMEEEESDEQEVKQEPEEES